MLSVVGILERKAWSIVVSPSLIAVPIPISTTKSSAVMVYRLLSDCWKISSSLNWYVSFSPSTTCFLSQWVWFHHSHHLWSVVLRLLNLAYNWTWNYVAKSERRAIAFAVTGYCYHVINRPAWTAHDWALNCVWLPGYSPRSKETLACYLVLSKQLRFNCRFPKLERESSRVNGWPVFDLPPRVQNRYSCPVSLSIDNWWSRFR